MHVAPHPRFREVFCSGSRCVLAAQVSAGWTGPERLHQTPKGVKLQRVSAILEDWCLICCVGSKAGSRLEVQSKEIVQ